MIRKVLTVSKESCKEWWHSERSRTLKNMPKFIHFKLQITCHDNDGNNSFVLLPILSSHSERRILQHV